MGKKQVIIDTDCGIDDAQAIMMALAAPNIEVLGVTCVFGNTAVANVCQNVLRVLSICERQGVRLTMLSLNCKMGKSAVNDSCSPVLLGKSLQLTSYLLTLLITLKFPSKVVIAHFQCR